MSEKPIVFLTDIKSTEYDDQCGMKYWLHKYEGGSGILKQSNVIPDSILDSSEDDLRALAQMEDISPEAIQEVCNDLLGKLTEEDKKDTDKMELVMRRLGWFAAFAIFIEPHIRATFNTIPIDDHIVLDRDPLWVVVRPGRILENKSTKEIVYREYVPMPAVLNKQSWLHQWHFNIRLHAGIEAAEQTLQKKISYGQVTGLSLGYRSSADNKLAHPYVRGYRNENNLRDWLTGLEGVRDGNSWIPCGTWHYDRGITNWVMRCGRDVAERQFPNSPITYLDKRVVDEWAARRIHRERMAKFVETECATNKHERNIMFERRTGMCRPFNQDPCPYLNACWKAELRESPFKGGEYIPNIPIPMVQAEVVA